MSETATLGVIRDLFAVAGVALAFALIIYAALRAGAGPLSNGEGNVLSRPYNLSDGIAAFLLAAFFAWSSTVAVPQTSPSDDVVSGMQEGALLFGMIFMLVIALALLAFMKIRGHDPGEMFGIRQVSVARAFGLGLGMLVPVYVAVVLVRWIVVDKIFAGQFPDSSAQESVESFQSADGIFFKLLLGAAAIIVAPVAEEVIFRGYLYGVTKRFTDRWFATAFTSLIFACVHRHVGSMVPLFTLAVGFSFVYEATGCLLVPMAMHAIFNLFNLLLLSAAGGS